MEQIKKSVTTNRKDKNKRYFLLGVNTDGEKVYLAEGSWDCNWYWGFGYIETAHSHSHYNSSMVGFKNGIDYVHHINANPDFVSTTITNDEAWQLSELMEQFYTLKAAAELFRRGDAYVTGETPIRDLIKDTDLETRINKVMIPAIMEEVYKLLSPNQTA